MSRLALAGVKTSVPLRIVSTPFFEQIFDEGLLNLTESNDADGLI